MLIRIKYYIYLRLDLLLIWWEAIIRLFIRQESLILATHSLRVFFRLNKNHQNIIEIIKQKITFSLSKPQITVVKLPFSRSKPQTASCNSHATQWCSTRQTSTSPWSSWKRRISQSSNSMTWFSNKFPNNNCNPQPLYRHTRKHMRS
jgi:hypothetical protein